MNSRWEVLIIPNNPQTVRSQPLPVQSLPMTITTTWQPLPMTISTTWQPPPHDNHQHALYNQHLSPLPGFILQENHHHMTITTTWQSLPHDNHHHMTITTTYLPTHSFGQMSPNYNSELFCPSRRFFDWIYIVIRCPNAVQTFLENSTIQSMVLVSGFMKNIEQENTHLMYFYMVNNKLDTLIEIIIFFWPWFRKQTVGIKFQLHGGCI